MIKSRKCCSCIWLRRYRTLSKYWSIWKT